MADTFDSRLKLRLQESGANSGQWGTLLNQTITNIASVFGFGTHQLTSDADATLTLSDDGASVDALKSSYLKITSSVSLTATRTLTFAPNTFNQVKYIENATSGSQSITISQGSGANVTIESGATKVVYFDGAGSGAAVVDALANIDQGTAEFDTIRVSTIKANDGTASSTIADSTGIMTIASAVLTTADINGGTIDGTVIGGSTAAAGSFTTLQASTSLNVDGSVTADGLTVDGTGAEVISVNSTANGSQINFDSATTSSDWSVGIANDSTDDFLIYQAAAGSGDIRLYTEGKERLEVNNNGDISFYNSAGTSQSLFWDASAEALGIGSSDPKSTLEVKGTFGAPATSGSAAGFIQRFSQTSGVGSLDVGFGDPYSWLQSRASNNYATNFDLALQPNGGNVLVGKTAAGANTAGVELASVGIGVFTYAGRPLYLNRLTNDGDIIEFAKDGTTVGSIGCNAGSVAFGQVSTAIGAFNTDRILFPATATGQVQDNQIDLGYSNGRFDDIYATNSTIQTSDRNEKQDIEALTDAEQRVAVAAKGLLRKFRWKSAVEEKGDDARIHFGIIAQDLQDAFTAEGLDAGRYAMFISTTWTDEETGEERTRMGVRYSELLAFIISAI